MNLYVGNLPYKLTDSELKDLFVPFGEVKSVKIIKDQNTDRSKGFGFVVMADGNDAQQAIKELDGTNVLDRQIIVNEARPIKRRPGGRQSRY